MAQRRTPTSRDGTFVVTLTDAMGRQSSEQITLVVKPTETNSHSIVGTPDGGGYWMTTTAGKVYHFGDAGFYGDTSTNVLNQPVVGIAATPDGHGYWFVANDGGVFSYGDARFHGNSVGSHLRGAIAAIAPTPDGDGYWLDGTDGGVFAFGSAHFYGSEGDSLPAPHVS
jgi:hypothetical protein